jgi:hypothetical protein
MMAGPPKLRAARFRNQISPRKSASVYLYGVNE